jgi:hypothetical protein
MAVMTAFFVARYEPVSVGDVTHAGPNGNQPQLVQLNFVAGHARNSDYDVE